MRNNQDNQLTTHSLSNISYIKLYNEASNDNHAVTKSYVDSLSESYRKKRDLSLVFNGQDKEFDKNQLTILESATSNRKALLNEEVLYKLHLDDELDKITLVRNNKKERIIF